MPEIRIRFGEFDRDVAFAVARAADRHHFAFYSFSCDFVLELENFANAFTIPRQAMFDKEGKRIAYRKRGDRFEPIPITISSSSAGRVVVTKGLVKGDELALTDPTAKKDEG